jgi:hypothetical protein
MNILKSILILTAMFATTGGSLLLADEPPPAATKQVLCRARCFTDVKDSLREFSPLRSGNTLVGDTETLGGTIRILQKHALLRPNGEPSLAFTLGRKAQYRVGASGKNDELLSGWQIELSGVEKDGRLLLDAHLRFADGAIVREAKTSISVRPNESAIIRLNPTTTVGASTKSGNPPIYVLLTAEVLSAGTIPGLETGAAN